MTRRGGASPTDDELRVARMWRQELRLSRQQDWSSNAAGVDEAGRGPLAGPVVAAAVLLRRRTYICSLDDSKRLTPGKRELLSREIKDVALAWAVAEVSVEEIDLSNILRASHQAMRKALEGLAVKTSFAGALLDGLPVPGLGWPHLAVVDGDALCPSIAAASIIAKVHRDGLMVGLDEIYPQYGFAKHKGYATAEHVAALRAHGPCPVHRRSFSWRGSNLFELAGDRESPS